MFVYPIDVKGKDAERIKGVRNMSIYTNLKTDYSTLFSSLSTSKNGNSSSNLLSNINLTDYYNIKSGSYYKLMKAYYAKNTAEESSSTTTDKNKVGTKTATEASQIKGEADTLYNAAEKLTATGSDSLFRKKEITNTAEDGTKTTTTDYDRDAIKGAVQDFINGYNKLVSSAGSTSSSSVQRAAQGMVDLSAVFSNQLGRVGISVGMDGKLSMDTEAFEKADMSKVQNLFNGANSYADSIGGYASSIRNYAKSDMNFGNTYDQNGQYSTLQNGLNYNSFF